MALKEDTNKEETAEGDKMEVENDVVETELQCPAIFVKKIVGFN